MNTIKKIEPKKILVRNTEKPLPKTRLIDEKFEDTLKKKLTTKPQIQGNENPIKNNLKEGHKAKFQSPEMNSALLIAKKIERVEKTIPRKTKNVSESAFCEKVTRKINFPSDQAIFKDLISLQVPVKSNPIIISREPQPQKDREPSLASFAKPKEAKEFIYEPSNKPAIPQIPTNNINNLRLYYASTPINTFY